MGKKNKKKQQLSIDDDEDETGGSRSVSSAAVAREVDADLLRTEMKSVLSKYPDKPDDWLWRTLEKNLKLKKKSLSFMTERLSAMRRDVEDELEDEAGDEGGDLVEEEGDRAEEEEARMKEAMAIETARARAEARTMGMQVREETDGGEGAAEEEGDDGDEDGATTATTTAASSSTERRSPLPAVTESTTVSGLSAVLLSLRPYVTSSTSSSSKDDAPPPTSAFAFLWIVLFHFLSFLLGKDQTLLVEALYVRDAPKRFAASKRAEEEAIAAEEAIDDELRSDHLWCPNSLKWIPYDGRYAADEGSPETIRCSGKGGTKWDRWSKNLKTRTKKTGPMSRGSWMPIKIGDGWATAPTKPETEDVHLADLDVRFFGCVETGAIVDVTTWATSALLSQRTARALKVVDNGKVLFRLSTEGKDEGKGMEGWVLESYVEMAEDGGDAGGGRSRKSRADKRSKKMGYAR